MKNSRTMQHKMQVFLTEFKKEKVINSTVCVYYSDNCELIWWQDYFLLERVYIPLKYLVPFKL